MLIRLEQVGKTYRTGSIDIPAIQKIDLTIQGGEFVAILGQSGSGKTTLLDILGCLSRPTEGRYWLDDVLVSSLADPDLAAIRNRKIGFVFQSFHLLTRKTALENVELPLQYAGVAPRDRRDRALEALHRVGLADRCTHVPNQLSGGQQQRVAIARALINHPSLLLADEPTGSLDTQSGRDILDVLLALHSRGQTVVLITHERELANSAQRLVTLRDGRIISDEPQDAALIAPPTSKGPAA
jgi:putative ABC transport system ATP-binding protein